DAAVWGKREVRHAFWLLMLQYAWTTADLTDERAILAARNFLGSRYRALVTEFDVDLLHVDGTSPILVVERTADDHMSRKLLDSELMRGTAVGAFTAAIAVG